MDPGILTLIIFGSLIFFLLLGIPVAFAMGAISLIIGFFFWSGEASIVGFVLGENLIYFKQIIKWISIINKHKNYNNRGYYEQ